MCPTLRSGTDVNSHGHNYLTKHVISVWLHSFFLFHTRSFTCIGHFMQDAFSYPQQPFARMCLLTNVTIHAIALFVRPHHYSSCTDLGTDIAVKFLLLFIDFIAFCATPNASIFVFLAAIHFQQRVELMHMHYPMIIVMVVSID